MGEQMALMANARYGSSRLLEAAEADGAEGVARVLAEFAREQER